MMTFKRHLVAALLVIILGSLAGVSWLIYSNQRAEMESERGERHTREVIQQLGNLLSSLKDAETRQRGFIITGTPDYLEPYQASLAEIAIGLADLRRLTADNPQQQQRLDALTPLVAARLADLKETIALRESQGFPVASAAITTQSGRKIMDEIRALVAEAQAQEAQLLKERVAIHASDNRRTIQSVALGSALGGLALLLLLMRLRWELASRQRAETVSRAGEQRLRLATDAAELGIWSWQPDGDDISWENDRPYDIFCMPRTDAPLTAARFAAEFVHPEDLAAFERAIADTVQNGARLFYQGRFHCPDGELRWVEFTGQPVPGTGGPSLRVIGTVQNITRRKQAEEAQARLAKIVETSDDAIISKSIDGIIQTWNAGAERMFGYPAEEAVGKPITLLIPPERLPEEEQIQQLLRRGKAVEPYETLRLTRDGRHIDVSLTISPLKNADGEVVGASKIVRNITERKQAEDALRESEAFSRSIIKSSPDCIKVLDLEGNLLSMESGQELLGIEEIEPFLNKLWVDFWESEKDKQAAQAALASAAASGAGAFVGFFRTLHGKPKWWDVAISTILDANGKPARLLAVSRDVTQRQQADDVLRQRTAQFETLLDEAPVGIYLIDADFRIRHVNPAGLPKFEDIPDLIGRDFAEVMHILWSKTQADEAVKQFRHTLETGEPCVVPEMIEKRADRGTIEYYEWQISRIPLPDGRYGVVCYFRDISERVLAQQKIQDSEQRFRAMVLASSDLMCRLNPDWSEMLQIYDKDFVVNTQVANPDWLQYYVHRDDQPRLMALAHEAIRTKSVFDMEHRIRRADGSWGWMLSRAVPLLDARGEIFEWFGAGSDVTEQKRAEQALRESERFLRSSLDALSGHIAVLDESGTILETNTAWQRFGNENDAAGAGISVGANYLQHCEPLWPDDPAQAYAREIREVIAGRQTRFEVEYPCHSPTEQRWFVMRVTRFQNPGPVRIVIVHDNCTERRRAEEALRVSEERLRLAADAAHFGMYDRDLGGGNVHISAQIRQMLGYEPDAPLDHAQLMSHFHPDDQRAGLAAFQRACDPAGDGRIAIEQRIVRCDGAVRWISSVGRVLFEDGVPKRSIGFLVDITERNRLERETLEQAQVLADLDRRKDEFLAMLSHELRNPLAALSNAVQLLRLQKSEAPLQQQARHVIERQLGQLTHLVDDLLEVSRITTGRVQLRQQQIALGGIVERAVETAQPLIAQRRHLLKVLLPLEPVFMLGDAARLEQVLVNLLTNAAKYTDEGGHIWLNVEAEAKGAAAPVVVIRVRDTGIGIAPELLPRIFDLFTQADRSLDRSQGGLGIGLCLVQRLVEMHGGSVEAHSVLGQGSEFVVRLPLMLKALPATSALPSPALETAQPTTKGCRVLVVDDNVDATQSLAKLLEFTGHEVRLAYDGPSALAAAIDYRPDVVLLDIGLPGLSGFEVAEQIHQQAGLRHIVLVALTGYGQDTDRQLSQDAGFDYHLVKPARFSEIEKILLRVSERVT